MSNEDQARHIEQIVQTAVDRALESKLVVIHEQIRMHGMSTDERRYLDLAIRREARREQLQTAIIEKSTVGFVWFVLAAAGVALWKAFVAHVKVGV
jgi:hypothetical protein